MLAELVDPLVRNRHALAAFHLERLGDDGDSQDAELLGDLRHDRRRARSRAATHAGRDEQHVGTFDDLVNPVAIFHCGLAAYFGIGAGAESLGDIAADLQRRADAGALQRLGVRVGTDEVDTLDAGIDHVSHGIATAATDTDDLDDSALAVCVH